MGEKNSEIVAIFNRYKDTLDDFIDSSDPESLPGPIDERSQNTPRSRGGSTGLPEKDRLDEDYVSASDKSPQLAAKTGNFQLHQRYDVAPLNPKKGSAQYEKGQRGEEGGGGNKINPVIGGSSGSKASIYHHKIYRY